jgi:pimeloyl-ACP methyl ester carboxylesterase
VPDRQTVVFLHGQPGTSVESLQLRRALPPWLHLVAPDRPGYGANPKPATGFFGNARFVLDVLDGIDVESATLVGHSWGGGIALRVAQQHPERVDALVLAASVGPDCLNWIDRLLALPFAGEAISAPAFVLAAPLARSRYRVLIGMDSVVERERALIERTLHGASRRATWRSFLVEQRALFTELPAIEAELDRIEVPTTVVTGTKDHFVPAKTARSLSQLIPDARLEIIDGVGHVLQLRAPMALARVIVDTVERATPTP